MFDFKKLLPRTLFGRSLLIIITPVLLLQLFATYVFYERHWNRMSDRLAFALVGEIAMIVEQIEHDASVNEVLVKAVSHLDLSLHFSPIQDLPLRIVEGWRPELVANTLERAMNKELSRPYTIQIPPKERVIDIAVKLDEGVLFISAPERRLFSSSSYIFILWMVALSLFLFSIAIVFMRNQIRPIRKLAIAADWFGRGKDVTKFKPEGAKEVRQAANAFITMRERLKRQLSQRTLMLAGVSHDLRTPLTRMKLQLEMLADNPDCKDLCSDIAEMEEMISGYLDFVRGEGEEAPEILDVKALLEGIIWDAKRQNISVNIKKPLDYAVSLWIRPKAFTRCIQNLIMNASRFADVIEMRFQVDHEGERLDLFIDDDGPGIPEGQREEVLKPFYRIETSRNKKTGGVGLGLSIALDIIHAHGGTLELGTSPLGGLRVHIALPI